MPGTADGMRAHDTLLGYAPLSRHGACWYYVWQAYAAAGAWTNQGSTPTAYQGWNATQGKHPGDMNPPPGAAIWLGRRYDGNMDGDVFIAGAWDGDHSATDQPNYGDTGTTSIEARMNLCGREYLGWSDHVLDCPINMGGQPLPPTYKTGSDMEIVMVVPSGTVVHFGGTFKYNFTSIEEYDRIRGDIEFFRARGGIEAMALPELGDVVGVDWDTYTRFCRYFGAPEN